MRDDISRRLRLLPKIDALLARSDIAGLDAPRWAVRQALRHVVAELRARILAGEAVALDQDGKVAIDRDELEHAIQRCVAFSLRRVINATGVILHTNLGRAPLAEPAIDHVVATACGYSNLEYDLHAGTRGSRHDHTAALLARLTGAEDALVVNNNAAAVLLVLAALAPGREVVVSRGELVEIGGSFRIPDVMRMAGATLVEVGTTNKTRIKDYAAAITENTAILLKVHPSNYAIVGFTHEASAAEIAALGRARGLVTAMDLGSGSLVSPEQCTALGLPAEPTVAQTMASGLDLVTFSGDKLLGGPQAGVICGARRWVETLRAHPLVRALRPDKMALAALEATLALYRDGAGHDIPSWSMLAEPADSVRARAEHALAWLAADLGREHTPSDRTFGDLVVQLAPCESTVGGGTMPLARIPSHGLALHSSCRSARAIVRALHGLPLPIVGRISDQRVLLDLRTVREPEMAALVDGLAVVVEGFMGTRSEA